MKTSNRATTVWEGSGKQGKGSFSTPSGVLDAASISFRKRFEGEQGTNPEELIAAAHAGCFSMALAVQLEQAGFTAERLETSAVVTLEKVPDGFSITRSDLSLRAQVPGIEREAFGRIAEAAKTGCPVSKLLKAEVSLQWELA
ncbi:MAG: OsmC family protein [Burkholderiaceae bacterium]|nr:OsmC family protein [Burkholderiaceae bacterium]